jgi:DNA-binding NtrC family response regulator
MMWTGPFILCVDDDPATRDAFASWAEVLALPAETFATAESAASRLGRGDVGVLLTDSMRRAGMSGLQLLEHARVVSPETLLVSVSGRVDDEYQAAAAKLAHHVVGKPWQSSQMEQIIRSGPSLADLAYSAAVRVSREIDKSIERMAHGRERRA